MNGVVINKQKNSFSFSKVLWMFALTLFFAISMNYDWRNRYLFWYGSLALVFVAYFLVFNKRIVLKNFSFECWLLSFMALGVISLSWSLSADTGMVVIKTLVVCFAVLFLIHSSLNCGFEVDAALRCYFVATLVNVVYIASMIDLTSLGEVQLGDNLIEGWNGNGIGFMMAQGVLIGCYLFKQAQQKLKKIVLLIFAILLAILTMYTGSRTAFIMLAAELILFFWLSHPTKMMRNIIVTVLVLGGALYLAMNVESFYNVLGSRLEGLFAFFGGEGEVDTSTSIRDTFIENGKKWFLEDPIVGYGINNYKVLNQSATGRFTYAHNNFIEMAVNLGVVGLVWYYSVFLYLIIRLLKLFRNNSLNIFLLSALVASFISQYGSVSYYGFYLNFLLLLCFWGVNHMGKEKSILSSTQVN